MAFKAVAIPASTPEKVNEWSPPNLSGGLNVRDLPQKLEPNQSPDLQNVWYQNNMLSKRMGQEITFSLGSKPIYNMCDSLDGKSLIIHVGTDIISVLKTQF